MSTQLIRSRNAPTRVPRGPLLRAQVRPDLIKSIRERDNHASYSRALDGLGLLQQNPPNTPQIMAYQDPGVPQSEWIGELERQCQG